ncbi:LAQU0S01e05138g1_1 [Lachancea quebecensis]|uniref:LAQU0S01e05138g1_1 n=1 Tax=Lachancea quebecensis TaxID=1654605 RepID=A0A0P1KKZ1_9SACH|nr:LAQU0S01e05138g1_1 [Lachancea quebecensis]
MRAPPAPRKSRARFVRRKAGQAYQVLSLRRLKRKYNLHRLHKIHRSNIRGGNPRGLPPYKCETLSLSDELLHITSNSVSPAAKHKPLLIASFPNGCSRSPRVKILQKNMLSRFWISKRRFKLRRFNPGLERALIDEEDTLGDDYFRSCRLIRKQTSKFADVKFDFEKKNVFKTVCMSIDHLEDRNPQFLEFNAGQSIRLEEFPSLNLAREETSINEKPGSFTVDCGVNVFQQLRRKAKHKLEWLRWNVSELAPRISALDAPEVFIVSGMVRPYDPSSDLLDAEVRIMQTKIAALVEASRHAGSAFSSYNQMLRKLETISPRASKTIRRATARRIVR